VSHYYAASQQLPGHVYHSTFADSVQSIAAEGLLPGKGGHWGGDLGARSYGKLFFADSVEDALYYSLIVFRERLTNFGTCPLPVVLRVPPPSIPGGLARSRDSTEESWTESGVLPEEIEILWHGAWGPVSSSQLDSDYQYSRRDDDLDAYEDWEGECFDTVNDAIEDVRSLYLPGRTNQGVEGSRYAQISRLIAGARSAASIRATSGTALWVSPDGKAFYAKEDHERWAEVNRGMLEREYGIDFDEPIGEEVDIGVGRRGLAGSKLSKLLARGWIRGRAFFSGGRAATIALEATEAPGLLDRFEDMLTEHFPEVWSRAGITILVNGEEADSSDLQEYGNLRGAVRAKGRRPVSV